MMLQAGALLSASFVPRAHSFCFTCDGCVQACLLRFLLCNLVLLVFLMRWISVARLEAMYAVLKSYYFS
jgi:hypothetical protein